MIKITHSSLKSIVMFIILLFSGNYCLAKVSATSKYPDKNKTTKHTVHSVADTIAMVSGNLSITLDTVQDNVINQYQVSIKFKLNYAIAHKIKVIILIDPLQPLQNISLYKDNSDTITFDQADWAAKQSDSTIKKTINLSLQQQKLVTNEQNIVLHQQNAASNFVIRLMPFAGKIKPKPGLKNLVNSGDAEIISTRAGISHYYNNKINSIDSIQLKVKVYGDYNPDKNVLSFALLDTSLNKHFKIWPNPDTITEREWKAAVAKYRAENKPTDNIGILNVRLKIKSINLTDSLNNVPYIDIILNGQNHIDGGSQKLKMSIKDKPFWAEIGTNFDLLDNIKTSNFYAGVYMFDKEVSTFNPINWFKKKKDRNHTNNLSFTGGVYESQSLSTGSRPDSTFNYKDGAHILYNKNGTIHGYQYYSDTGIIKNTTQVKSIGIFFSPQLRLTTGKMDENGLHISASLYAELLWQRVSSSFDYSKAKLVTTIFLDSTKSIPSSIPYRQQSFALDYRSHYYGLGLPIYIKANGYNLYINTVLGITNQRFVITDNSAPLNTKQYSPTVQDIDLSYTQFLNFAQPKSRWNNFYIVQYRLNEVAYGITFSGEIRGLFLYGSKPVITLALSKKFDLSALLKPLVAPF